MAIYTLTDQAICNEIQYHLLEIANSGASYGSSLFSTTEVVAALNHRIAEFTARTAWRVDVYTKASIANQNSLAFPTTGTVSSLPPMDIIRVSFTDTNGDLQQVPKGSKEEAQLVVADLIGSNAAVDVPYIWTYDDSDFDHIFFYPPPDSVRTVSILAVPRPAALPDPPDGTVIEIPDDFVWAVKYGALADLFSKQNETHDPLRAQVCNQLFELGVETCKSLMNRTP